MILSPSASLCLCHTVHLLSMSCLCVFESILLSLLCVFATFSVYVSLSTLTLSFLSFGVSISFISVSQYICLSP